MKVYKYKLYQSTHFNKLRSLLKIGAEIYNHCIKLHQRYYKTRKKYLKSAKLQKHITKLKKLNKYKHWKKLNSQAIQDIVQRIDRGYKLFFKKDAKRPPQIKSWRKYASITLKQTGYKFENNGKIKILGKTFTYFNSKRLCEGNIKTISVKKDKVGNFYICVTTDFVDKKVKTLTGKTAGFDFGLKTFLTSNLGEKISCPLFFKKSLKKLKKLSKRLSKKVKYSNNRKKARKALAKKHLQVAQQRQDWQYKLALDLVSKYDELYFETLNIAAMKRMWGKKVSDLGFSNFMLILANKCKEYGKQLINIDPFDATSKTCHCCGQKNTELHLYDRFWRCSSCYAEHDRDINAAKNIYAVGASTARLGPVRLADLFKSASMAHRS